MTKYLYGASIQGIQEFIFKTNKLKEIVGASEIIEEICTTFFKTKCPAFNEANLIIGAAGNIKYVFDNDVDCKALVLSFPKAVMARAPGITISQAVVKIDGNDLQTATEQLIKNLKTQRNKVPMPFETGFMALERSRRTGGVGFERKDEKDEVIDEATCLKTAADKRPLFEKLTGFSNVPHDGVTYNIEDITKTANHKWIAIIHADGNGLGKIIQSLGDTIKQSGLEEQIKILRKFSVQLEEATKASAQYAFKEVVESEFHLNKGNKLYPIRPIIMGGDDITLVIRGDLALNFTDIFLKRFEDECAEKLSFLKNYIGDRYKLTACAGIAYIKESYPFHYGVDLADKLCKEAKSFSKNNFKDEVPSSLSFYKVQDSFIESELESIRDRTQLAGMGILNYNYGPYLLHKNGNAASLINFNALLTEIKKEADKNDKSKGVSKLRQLISESFKEIEKTKFMKERMKSINNNFFNLLNLDENFPLEKRTTSAEDEVLTSPLYDLIQIHSIQYKAKN